MVCRLERAASHLAPCSCPPPPRASSQLLGHQGKGAGQATQLVLARARPALGAEVAPGHIAHALRPAAAAAAPDDCPAAPPAAPRQIPPGRGSSVSVPIYMRCSPAGQRTLLVLAVGLLHARALVTSAAGKGKVACKKRGSGQQAQPPDWAPAPKRFTRTADKCTAPVVRQSSSSPSMLVRGRWLPAGCAAAAALGRSGLRSSKRLAGAGHGHAGAVPQHHIDGPELVADALQHQPCPRHRAPGPAGLLALRVLLAMSLAMVSRVTLARLTPGASAPSTFTSNQLSIAARARTGRTPHKSARPRHHAHQGEDGRPA